MKTIETAVRERRIALKLSQPQLAKKWRITYQAIQQLEPAGQQGSVLIAAPWASAPNGCRRRRVAPPARRAAARRHPANR